jgi:prolipoprotein diacylglyceryltransferase
LKFPYFITLGSSPILWHTIFETLGFFIGFRYFIFLRKKQTNPIISNNRIWILIGTIFCALIGSRIIDAYDFDVRAIKKSCVHIVHKNGNIIHFETMNLFYRDDKEAYLKELQAKKITFN